MKTLSFEDILATKHRSMILYEYFQGQLSCLRQFLITESPLKIMKNAFCFMLKAPFVLGIFTFLS